MQTASAIAFVQEAASEKSKPIKLTLAEGSSKYHKAPERPQPSKGSAGIPASASHQLKTDSTQHNKFKMGEFFHCAFGCEHKIKCEESCMKKHSLNIKSFLHIKRAEGSDRHYAVIV